MSSEFEDKQVAKSFGALMLFALQATVHLSVECRAIVLIFFIVKDDKVSPGIT